MTRTSAAKKLIKLGNMLDDNGFPNLADYMEKLAMRPFDQSKDVADQAKWENFLGRFESGHSPIVEVGRGKKGAAEYKISPEMMKEVYHNLYLGVYNGKERSPLTKIGLPEAESYTLWRSEKPFVKEHERIHREQFDEKKERPKWTASWDFPDERTNPEEVHAYLMSVINWFEAKGGVDKVEQIIADPVKYMGFPDDSTDARKYLKMIVEFVKRIPKANLAKIKLNPDMQWEYALELAKQVNLFYLRETRSQKRKQLREKTSPHHMRAYDFWSDRDYRRMLDKAVDIPKIDYEGNQIIKFPEPMRRRRWPLPTKLRRKP